MAKSAVTYIYDADTSFRAPGSAAVIANVASVLPLDKLTKSRGDQLNKLGAQSYAVVIAVSAHDFGDANETYVFTVNVGDTGAGGTTAVGTVTVTGTGQWVVLIDAETIEKLDANHAEIELDLVVGGTTPSITFAAWLALG
jgi:hypothetical protein